MKQINKVKNYWCGLLLLISPIVYGDVLVNVAATMVDPACHVRSEDGSSPLQINFGVVEINGAPEVSLTKDFPVYISGCSGRKTLSVLLNPKGYGTEEYLGRHILSTSAKGLGIHFLDVTDGQAIPLELNQLQALTPQPISTTEHRIDLQAQLVNTRPLNQLPAGRFTSAMMISVTYN
ncbi:TPA: fimbrial protein [Providencia alcalifaciens]|uniref:Fimbrial protein n=2 Tax=Providencia alcalifaciens TaxID=126385 RepID=A0AAW9V8R8_9GAMM|nr:MULTISPECIES: fimbrial protein [Providencia]ATG15191.1 fimbrial protein [Providencia alcalifaciens]EEB46601.1 fimbrial protein [Providencia alcalifaciens DSM 30120]EKT62811.1 fimbrial subunit [Providencia alcalifaciens Dmel2]ETT06709.1 fimbrial protein [Providencia alcalifaciens F90-2004]EUC95337.1 fimbrial protein [Providencia alcalifaciens PAL-2]